MDDSPDGLEIVLPAPRNWLVSGGFSVWLVGWTLGEVSALRGLLGHTPVSARGFLALGLALDPLEAQQVAARLRARHAFAS